MPELPEVETVRTGLEMVLEGAVIKSVELRRKDLRTPLPADLHKKLAGRKIKHIGRRAKYLLFSFDSDDVLIAHLGMSGRFTVCHPTPTPHLLRGAGSDADKSQMPQQVRHDNNKHDHVVFTLKDGRCLIYNDARRFGLIELTTKQQLPKHRLFKHLGPEPLSKNFSPVYLKEQLLGKKAPIKTAIMDQALVVGVGNIYASEALFFAKIHPETPAHKAAKHAPLLIKSIQTVLRSAIASGGSSLRDFVKVSGEAGYFQHQFNVYAKAGKPCVSCHIPLRSIRMAGRSTFFCPTCQK